MSDRIDELVRRIRLASTTAEYAADHEAWLAELATTALKAEAMCEWLAERLEESDDTVLAADTWLVAARKAVQYDTP